MTPDKYTAFLDKYRIQIDPNTNLPDRRSLNSIEYQLIFKKLKDIFIAHYDKNLVEIIGYKENF